MSDSPDSLVLELLRGIRSDVSGLRDDMADVKRRITSLESQVALLHGDFAGQSLRLDRVGIDIDQIKKRIGLIDA